MLANLGTSSPVAQRTSIKAIANLIEDGYTGLIKSDGLNGKNLKWLYASFDPIYLQLSLLIN